MNLTVFFIAIGLAMDALAVSVGKGITLKGNKLRNAAELAICFGVFQFVMPVLGYYCGTSFSNLISAFDHWVAFLLLTLIGGKMLWEALKKEKEEEKDERISFKMLMLLSLATSIDALAVGVSFAMLNTPIFVPSIVIGVVCFILSFTGYFAGRKLGHLFEKRFEFLGGVILVGIGIKILVEHLK